MFSYKCYISYNFQDKIYRKENILKKTSIIILIPIKLAKTKVNIVFPLCTAVFATM